MDENRQRPVPVTNEELIARIKEFNKNVGGFAETVDLLKPIFHTEVKDDSASD